MARGLRPYEGSPMIGSPIVYNVDADVVPDNCTFHRLILTVTAALSSAPDDGTELTLSAPVESGEVVAFDISSALRAAADRYVYSPIPDSPDIDYFQFPHIIYNLHARDEYMSNGELLNGNTETSIENTIALMGAFSDFDRLLYPPMAGFKKVQHFTRKPKSLPEVVMVGETMVCPQSFDNPVTGNAVISAPISRIVEVEDEGMQVINGRSVYALPPGQSDRYQFRFVNALGCMESISLTALRTTEVNYNIESYIRTIQGSFKKFSRGITTKRNDYETWKLCTPPLDDLWQSWFLHEFLMSGNVWIKIGDSWIPCHIIPEETTQGLNRVDNTMLSISFSVKLDINGSPLPDLAL